MKQRKPLICTFVQLAYALQALHLWNKADIDRLHDIWKLGAPTPTSRVQNPTGFDPRKVQAGNRESRVVFPAKLEAWVVDVATRRGISATPDEAYQLVSKVGRILDGDVTVLIEKAN